MTTLAIDSLPATTSTDLLPAWTQSRMDRAITIARDALAIDRTIVKEECLSEMVIVVTADSLLSVYGANAWTRPTEQPMLPWSAPLGTPVATVSLTGEVTHLYA